MVLVPSLAQLPTYRLWGVTVARDELFLLAALLALWATLGRWIYNDAEDRNSGWAWQWGFGTPLTVIAGLEVMLLVVVIYLLLRDSD
ncbi:hypothetical protein C461_06359 [Halorubrum aidingense JCM 13560]|uniref:Uncharacterized protein n=1 Tax=Halorubrum aidingense JCM 13560 TaxID=1230454 RepID=M0PDG7_9EURY|nr:hypothetical protein [Halorubrum aidingense]EMA68182.1 hypothetical protein C461_06359 [Halorubrum aidingense JCM 13560]